MDAKLYKYAINYFSSSGPGACREVCIPELEFRLNEFYDITNAHLHDSVIPRTQEVIFEYPFTPIHLSEQAVGEIHKLNDAYIALQKAQRAFDDAKKAFKASDGGKEVHTLLHPSPKLTLRDILSEETEKKIKEDLEALGYNIASFVPRKEGYSQVLITVKFEKENPPSLEIIKDFKSCDFKVSQGWMETSKKGVHECQLHYEKGQVYSPHYEEDLLEIAQNEYKRREALEEHDSKR